MESSMANPNPPAHADAASWDKSPNANGRHGITSATAPYRAETGVAKTVTTK